MPQKYKTPLRNYTLSISTSTEHSEDLATQFEQYFQNLEKYEQLVESVLIETGEWETAWANFIKSN